MNRILRSLSTYVALAIGLVGLSVILYAWRLPPFTSAIEVTENAYVRGQVTVIAPQLAGYIAEVAVQDFATVKQGQLLVRTDERIMRFLAGDDVILDREFLLHDIEASKAQPPTETLEWGALIRQVTGELTATGDARSADIRLDLGPPAPIRGDRAQMSQLLHNVIGNALKYGRAGTPVTLVSRLAPAVSPGFMNLTRTRWPISRGASLTATTTSTTRSSVRCEGSSEASLRAPKTAARRRTLPT